MKAVDLKSLTQDELVSFVAGLGHARYRSDQIYRWLYMHGVGRIDDMTNLPGSLRSELNSKVYLSRLTEITTRISSDGTRKILFEVESGNRFETVLIPDFDADGIVRRVTVCVSSQVGCAMGCTFCATGKMGFLQDLTAGDIFDQIFEAGVRSVAYFGRPLSNIVLMGMGEPLMNYDAVLECIRRVVSTDGLAMAARRITISTVGLAGRIVRLADEDIAVNLAVSLHAPTDRQRSSIMPVNRKAKTDLVALKQAIMYFTKTTGRRITYEYCVFDGFNDSITDANHLADVVHWAPSKVNLIMYNQVDGADFSSSPETRLDRFIKELVSRKVPVTVRRSRGQDIEAACGQLASA